MPATRFGDVRRFESVDSTNRYLLAEARAGAPEGVVAVADHQTAGRGRLGRRWEAPAGANLLVSVLLRPDLPSDRRHLAATVVSLAAAEAAEAVAGVAPALKWPNDLLLDGRKVAGVLAEADTAAGPDGQPPPVVVGIGLNVAWPASDADLPDDLVGTATSLQAASGREVDREALLDALLAALEPRVAALATAEGRADQVEAYRRRCGTVGAEVRVELAEGTVEGRAVGLTADGGLVVATADGERTVVAGDVVHLRPRTGA